MPQAVVANITGLVLAGGQGSRMGGADKGLVDYHGLPLIEHVLGRFSPQVSSVMISANRNVDRYRNLVPRVVSDVASASEAFRGPLAGIHAGLLHAQTAWVAVVPCDAPQLPRVLVARLADAINARGALAACARADGRLQSVFCMLSTSLVASLDDYMENAGRAVHGWLAAVNVVPVDFDDPIAFRNVNTVGALAGGAL